MTTMIAYDGRENTRRALEYAISHSVTYGDRLYIVSVIPKSSSSPEEISRVRAYMDEALEQARGRDVDAQALIESGSPEKDLLEAANRFSCDTIVVGRSSKTSFDRVIMGSVSNHIVANAKCNVIVVQ